MSPIVIVINALRLMIIACCLRNALFVKHSATENAKSSSSSAVKKLSLGPLGDVRGDEVDVGELLGELEGAYDP